MASIWGRRARAICSCWPPLGSTEALVRRESILNSPAGFRSAVAVSKLMVMRGMGVCGMVWPLAFTPTAMSMAITIFCEVPLFSV